MSRVKTIEGNGLTLSYSTTSGTSGTPVGGVVSFTGGGYTREMLDDTDLSNTEWATKVASALKTANDVTVSVKALSAALPEGNVFWQMACGSLSLSFWGTVSASGDLELSSATPANRSITISVTNLDSAGAEAGPELTIGG